MKMKLIATTAILGLWSVTAACAASRLNANGDDDEKRVEVKREIAIGKIGQGSEAQFMNGQINGVNFFRIADKTVKNAPYSAEVISEHQQKLADGNVIATKTVSMTYRDSLGRMRQEIRDMKGELSEIIIVDSDYFNVLNPKTKTARRSALQFNITTKSTGKNGVAVTSESGRSKVSNEVIELKITSNDDAKNMDKSVVVRRLDKTVSDGKSSSGEAPRIVTVNVHEGNQIEAASGAALSDPSLLRVFGDVKWASKRISKTLGERDFDGIKAEGKLSSFEIPAGEIGNAQAIVVSDESWTSPGLQITVYSKHSDPRSGDRIYRLSNIKRDEVPASMFEIPTEYKLRDMAKEIKNMEPEIKEKIEKSLKK